MTGPLTVAAALDGTLGMNDLRLRPATLVRQAELAEADGNPQLGQNLRRAAEIVALPDAEVLAVYEALRPGRSSHAELIALAGSLERRDAPLCAELVRQAARACERRGLLR